MSIAFGLIAAYLLGSLPFGYLFVRLRLGIDVRELGSGNIGATNVWRVAGAGWGLATGLLDLAKGWLGVVIMQLIYPEVSEWGKVAAALSVIAGHSWTVWLRFRGGRGVLTAAGAFLGLAWAPVLASMAVFAMVLAVSRYVSLGSMVAAVSFVVFVILIPGKWQVQPVIIAAAATTLLIVIRHIPNLRRLAAGNESRLGRNNSDRVIAPEEIRKKEE
jgi:glycerol-3-phosphate acyltransferase PlsY